MHSVDVFETTLRFAQEASGRPYHAALVTKPASAGITAAHGHADYFEFMAVVAGQGNHVLPVGVQELRAGDVVLVRPEDRHAMQGTGPDGMRFVNVAFPAESWRAFTDIAGLPAATGVEPPQWRLDGTAAAHAGALFGRILDSFHHRPTTLDVLRFWTDLVELLWERSTTLDATQPPEWLVRVRAEMEREEHLCQGVPRMLELASVSAAHLSRSMRRYHGTTPTRFVADLRLRRATELLGTTSESVTRIAHRCGFSSQSYFTRCFGDAHGVSPREYRRNAWRAFVPE